SSAIGGVILTFAYGFQTYIEFLKGAHAMDLAALDSSLKNNIPLLSALIGIWNRDFLHYQTVAIIPYSQMLSRFSAHVQQVEMESNGKRIDRQGEPVDFDTSPIFWGEPGTNSQHSFFQTIHQGTTVVPIEFIGFKACQTGKDLEIQGSSSHEKLLSNMIAQSLALATGQTNSNPNKVFPGNRPSHIHFAEKLDPYTMGALFAYVEHKVAFQGFIWNINSFDQEGVQLGKVLANRFIDLYKSKRGHAVKTEFTPIELAYYDLLYPR
ncbi:MAG: glucose-6-phosphate isomerase, partial [Parachlamydiaceae bacterium]